MVSRRYSVAGIRSPVARAETTLERGNPNDAKVAMIDPKALISQLETQTGKRITGQVVAALIEGADATIAALGGGQAKIQDKIEDTY